MASRKVRNRIWAERRIAHDIAVQKGRIERENAEKAKEDKSPAPKKKAAKSTKKTVKKDK